MLRRILAIALLVLAGPAGANLVTYTATKTAPGPASPGGSLQTQLSFPTFDLTLGSLEAITFTAMPRFTGTAGAFLASDEHFLVTEQMNTILRLFGPGVSLLAAPAFGSAEVNTDRGFFHIVTDISNGAGPSVSVTPAPGFALDAFTSGAGAAVLLTVAIDPPNFSFPSIGNAPYPPTGYGSLATFGGTYAISYYFAPADGPPPQGLLSVAREAGGTRVRWRQPPGSTGSVEFSDSLDGAWQPLPGAITADASGVLEYFDSSQPAPLRRFYRLASPPANREADGTNVRLQRPLNFRR